MNTSALVKEFRDAFAAYQSASAQLVNAGVMNPDDLTTFKFEAERLFAAGEKVAGSDAALREIKISRVEMLLIAHEAKTAFSSLVAVLAMKLAEIQQPQIEAALQDMQAATQAALSNIHVARDEIDLDQLAKAMEEYEAMLVELHEIEAK